tara:strand:- start:1877 stop:2254 length:378 start_codon:yes stop_codon:yes gene_type:complete
MIIIGGDVSPSGFSERCLSQNPEILFKPSLKKLFEQLDSGVSDIDFVRTNWSKWVDSKKVDYFSRLLGWSRVKRVLFRYFDLLGFSKYSNRQAMIRNVVECESHREALETYWSDRGQVLRKSKKL